MPPDPQPDKPPRPPGLAPREQSETARPHSTPPPAGGGSGDGLVLASGSRPLAEYELAHLLGRGGFGEVWQARGPGGFDVALKFVRLGGPAGRVELRSLDLMKAIRHAHLVPLFGAWQRDGLLIVAMELADGTLLDRLHEAQGQGLPGIPAEELREYMREAAKGIDFLNDRRHPSGTGELAGIQHKDIKPQNLLLVGGTVKVADFGMARVLEHTVTAASGSMTPAYAAPEFLNGQATRWSDQYCLAVSYCQLRGGRLPFEGNHMQVMAGHMMNPPDLRMLPKVERPAVGRALAKMPEERWPSCRAFVEALATAAGAGSPGRNEDDRQGQATAPLPVSPKIPAKRRVPPAGQRTAPPPLPATRTERRRPPPQSQPEGGKRTPSPDRRWWRTLAVAGAVALLALALPGVALWSILGRSGRDRAGPDQGVRQTEAPGHPVGAKPVPPAPAAEPHPTEGAVRVTPALRLLPLGDVTVEAGQSKAVEVRVERRNVKGPVELRLEGLPAGVKARPGLVPSDKATGRVELSAGAEADLTSRVVRVVAVSGATRGEGELRLTVTPAPPDQERAVAEVRRLGGKVEVDEKRPDKPVVKVDLSKTAVTDAGLEHLKGLTGLQELNLEWTQVTDAGLAHLKELSQLRKLSLYFCKKVTDAGLAHLKGLTGLETLDLSFTSVTGAGLAQLKGLTRLGWLALSHTPVTDAGLEHLKELPRLPVLWLNGCAKVTDAGLEHLKGMTGLQRLYLNGTKVTDAGIQDLQKALPKVKVSK